MVIRNKINMVIAGILLISMLVLPVLAGCQGGAPTTPSTPGTPTAEPKTLKIGAGLPLSGPLSMVGAIWQQGLDMAFERVNQNGGLKIGNDVYKIELVLEDSKATPDGAATAANRLVYEEDVKFLLADFWDPDTSAFEKVTSEAGVLLVRCYGEISAALEGGDMFDVGPGKPLCIRLHPTDDESMKTPIEYLVKNYPDVKSVSLMDMDIPMWGALEPYTAKLLSGYGLKVAGEYTRFPMDTMDFMPIVTRVLQSQPDAIYVLHGALDQFVLIVKSARDSGFTGPIFYSSPYDVGLATKAVANLSDVFGNGVVLTAPNLPSSVQEIVDLGRGKYGSNFISDTLNAYDVPTLFTQLLVKAQSLDPKTVQDKFETMTAPGSLQSIFGPAHVGGLKTAGVNRILVRPVPMCRMVEGKGDYIGAFMNEVP
jgi:ABC-type branched-subunit amino acid transport system substrate-binding protein